MFTDITHVLVFLLVLSLIFPLWAIWRKTRSRAELIIAVGFTILAFIRLGIVFNWDIISNASQEWTLINTAIIAFGYWWLYLSSRNLWNTQAQIRKEEQEKDDAS
jgi:hypothetical protein